MGTMSMSMPLGSYVAVASPLHRMDARVKMALLLAATVALFVGSASVALPLAALCLLVGLRSSHVKAGSMLRALRPTVLVLAFSLLANALVADGTGDLTLVGAVGLSWPGLARGAVAVARIVALVGLSLLVSATTTAPQMADALIWAMSPLACIGVPVGDLAMVLSVSLRFIPECAVQFDRIRDAQRARGADFSEGSPVRRVSRWSSVLVPLVVTLFRRADILADAMRDRCYRGEGRTSLSCKPRPSDVVVLVCGIVISLVCCLSR